MSSDTMKACTITKPQERVYERAPMLRQVSDLKRKFEFKQEVCHCDRQYELLPIDQQSSTGNKLGGGGGGGWIAERWRMGITVHHS